MRIHRGFGAISVVCVAVSSLACARSPEAPPAAVAAPAQTAKATQHKLSPTEIAHRTRRSIVTVSAGERLGSGFFVAQGVVATNLHVVQGEQSIAIKTVDGAMYAVSAVRGFDHKVDLALLEIDGKPENAPLSLANSEGVSQGDAVFAVGSPRGLESTLSTGIVSAIRENDGNQVFQVTAPVAPGSSGGPALNDRGEVIGVITAMSTNAQNVGFAVPASYVRRLLASKNERLPTAEFATRSGAEAPQDEVPSTIAGFQLGMTLADASAMCNGELTGTPGQAVCPFAPVRVPFAKGDVHLELDAGRVSSILIHAGSWADVRAALSERYGPPTGYAVFQSGSWVNASSFDESRKSAAVWDFPQLEILAFSGDGGIDLKYVLKAANALRAAAY